MNYPTALGGPSFSFHVARDSNKLVMLFSGVGARDGRFQYWKVGRGLGTHCLFLNDGRKHWYQSGVPQLGESFEATLATIRLWVRELGVEEIYAIGQSMGAYGAILYGARLGARVLAFGAETILRLEGSRSSQLLRGDAAMLYPDLQDVIAGAEKPITTFAGERDPVDLYCMSRAHGLPQFDPRTILGLGHNIATPMHQDDLLVPLLRTFVENRRIPRLANEGGALLHPGFADAFYDLYRHIKAGRYDQSAAAGELAVSLYPNSDYAFFMTAKAVFALKDIARAASYMERALAIAPHEMDYRFLMARCLARLGQNDRALAMHEAILAERPEFANSFHHIALIHYTRRDYLKALEASRRAVDLRPDIQGFADVYAKIEKRLGKVAPVPDRAPLGTVSGLYRSFMDAVARRR